MLLRHEHGVKVPERALDESVCGHLGEARISGRAGGPEHDLPHVEEDLAELFPDFQERVQRSALGRLTRGRKVVLLEVGVFPGAAEGQRGGPVSSLSGRSTYEAIMSSVRSVSSCFTSVANCGPFLIE